mgnify:CR=1 FL=1
MNRSPSGVLSYVGSMGFKGRFVGCEESKFWAGSVVFGLEVRFCVSNVCVCICCVSECVGLDF